MPALISTFRSGSLADVGVDIDRCDEETGAALAMILAELGARIDIRGADALKLRDLHASIAAHWGHARIIDGAAEQEALIRIVDTAGEARDLLLSRAATNRSAAILIVTRPDETDLAPIARQFAPSRVHILALPHTADGDVSFDTGALAAVVIFLLSPAARDLAGQYLHIPAAQALSPIADRRSFPAMPVCAPAATD
jgi:hypothetical protein